MKKFIFAAMAALAVIASSCYEDKGSYDYHDVKIVDTIAFHWSSASRTGLSIGDTALLVANVVFTNPNENPDDWKYIWKINHEQVAEGLTYEYIPTKTGTDYLQFYIEHKTSGMRFYMYEHSASSVYASAYTSITIASPFFAGGWHVLSKKDGNVSCVDVLIRRSEYVDFINEYGEEDYWTRYYYDEYPDVYKSFHGEELGTNPSRMLPFFSTWSQKNSHEILVLQGTNNTESTFLGQDDFHKVVSLKQEFANDEWPNNSYVTDYFYGGSSNWAITNDGKLYGVIYGKNGGSTNMTAFSHIYNFLTTPMVLGENSFAKRFMTEITPYITKAAIVYDSGMNSYHFFYTDTNTSSTDQGYQVKGASITLKVNGVKTSAEDYFPSANVLGNYEALQWCFHNGSGSGGLYWVMGIKKHKETGELVYDYFDYRGASKKVTMNVYEENVPMPEGFTENTPYSYDRANKYFWFAKGKDIMFYDPTTKETRKYTTAASNVTALCVGPAADSRQRNQIAVGCEDKSITMYNIDNTVLQIAATKGDAKEYGDDGMGDSYKYWETKSTGVPVQIRPRHKHTTMLIYDQID